MWDLQGLSINELLVLNIEQNKQAELTNKNKSVYVLNKIMP